MRVLNITSNLSGAAEAGRRGDVVMVVDIIDMSTTAESFIDAGAIGIYGASPDDLQVPIKLSPESIGKMAGSLAMEHGSEVIIISEPRVGDDEERRRRASSAIRGVQACGAEVCAILPNLGWETVKMIEARHKVVLLITASGGAAFDAAIHGGAAGVVTATVARSIGKKGDEPALAAVSRAIEMAERMEANISVVASSSNAMEDLLAAEFIGKMIIAHGFLSL